MRQYDCIACIACFLLCPGMCNTCMSCTHTRQAGYQAAASQIHTLTALCGVLCYLLLPQARAGVEVAALRGRRASRKWRKSLRGRSCHSVVAVLLAGMMAEVRGGPCSCRCQPS